jgi:ABC-type multidrug transport system fused ATPase/permease subunit
MLSKERNKFSKLYSLFSRITFFWIIKLLRKGEKTKLKLNDFNDIDTNLKSETIGQQFVLKNEKTSGLMKALWKLIWIPITIATILELMSVITDFGSPYILGKILDYLSKKQIEQKFSEGFIYSLLYCLIITIERIISQNSYHYLEISRLRIQIALKQTIYKKFLKLSSESRREYNLGKFNSLLGKDCRELSFFSMRFMNLLIDPIRIISGIYFLWQYIGVVSITTVIVSIILGLLTHFLMKSIKKIYKNISKFSSEQTKLINEVFSNIKIIKLYAWEIPFINQINEIKSKELKESKVLLYWDSGKSIIYFFIAFNAKNFLSEVFLC